MIGEKKLSVLQNLSVRGEKKLVRKKEDRVLCRVCKEQKGRSEVMRAELIREPIIESLPTIRRKTTPFLRNVFLLTKTIIYSSNHFIIVPVIKGKIIN